MKVDLRTELKNETDDIIVEEVTVPEWKDKAGNPRKLYVRSLTGEERDYFEEQSLVRKGKSRETSLKNMRARLVVLAVCYGPDNHEPIFVQADVQWLTKKNGKALDRLFDVAARLSGITDKDIEELKGNLESGQSGDSGLNLDTATVSLA